VAEDANGRGGVAVDAVDDLEACLSQAMPTEAHAGSAEYREILQELVEDTLLKHEMRKARAIADQLFAIEHARLSNREATQ